MNRAAWALLGLVLSLGAGEAVSASEVSVVDDQGQVVALPQPARRIISLVPSLTESLCTLGACDRLVGTDRHSQWPATVLALPKLGGLEDVQVERVLALKPDLVVLSSASRAAERLRGLGLKVVVLDASRMEDVRRTLERLAVLLGVPERGLRTWQTMQARIGQAAARIPSSWKGRRAYFEVASNPYAAGESSFVGELLARLGLGNIVPADMGPFPLLNPEFVVKAQPDIVMASVANLAEMPARPGWSRLGALATRRACGFLPPEYDTLVRPGPRLAEAAEALADCLVRLSNQGTAP